MPSLSNLQAVSGFSSQPAWHRESLKNLQAFEEIRVVFAGIGDVSSKHNQNGVSDLNL